MGKISGFTGDPTLFFPKNIGIRCDVIGFICDRRSNEREKFGTSRGFFRKRREYFAFIRADFTFMWEIGVFSPES